ncbi:MAG: hypothetical protein J5I57_03485 [Melioribacteraceae bacterium]|nr:hypothetical protein [Melioribacteraceae bacterium]
MIKLYYSLFILMLLLPAADLSAQKLIISDQYLLMNASAEDPTYTTYAAAMSRSKLYEDKAYKMDYYTDCLPVNYSGDQAGKLYNIWKVDEVVVLNTGEYSRKPKIYASFPDMAILEHSPFTGIEVQETFFVYSSNIALIYFEITNVDKIPHNVQIYSVLEIGNESLNIKGYIDSASAYVSEHFETHKRLISNLYKNGDYPTDCRNIISTSADVYSFGSYDGNIDSLYNIVKTDFYSDDRSDSLNFAVTGNYDIKVLHTKFDLQPEESKSIKIIRGWQDAGKKPDSLLSKIQKVKTISLQKFVDENVDLFSSIPRINFDSTSEKQVYLSAFNLVRSSMLPPEGKTSYNYYVFSRNPLWGWGHGHQVLHESLSMIPYAYLDFHSAQNSQRVYIEQQSEDGLIAYRHGPRGIQDYPHFSKYTNSEMSTTSAPFFSWINWELFSVSKDTVFLNDAYNSGTKYLRWLEENRDLDNDGTFEWGPYGIIENVRDWYNAVFQVSADRFLDVDKEDISDELECLDLTLMIVKELRSLAKMAEAHNKLDEQNKLLKKAEYISELVNERMWDDSSQFYYSINKENHSFNYLSRDLRRMEIIGFLPLWAEAATEERAELIVRHMLDENKFWRKFGIPTLAADDPWYSPNVDYCCKWNGPVWLLWNYMVYEGLINYGYTDIADKLADKMVLAVSTQLSKNHNFWESYSPDNTVLNSPSNYIWDSIIAKVLIEKYRKKQK